MILTDTRIIKMKAKAEETMREKISGCRGNIILRIKLAYQGQESGRERNRLNHTVFAKVHTKNNVRKK